MGWKSWGSRRRRRREKCGWYIKCIKINRNTFKDKTQNKKEKYITRTHWRIKKNLMRPQERVLILWRQAGRIQRVASMLGVQWGW